MAGERGTAKARKRDTDGRAGDRPRGLRGSSEVTAGRDVDRLLYDRVRLGIMSALAVNRALGFPELRDLLDTSDGNLSVHARKLEDAGFVVCNKSFRGRKPRTEYRLSPRGRRALDRYLDHMEALIQATRES